MQTDGGDVPAIGETTLWSSVYANDMTQVGDGTSIVLYGTRSDGTTIDATTADNSYTVTYTNDIQDFIDHVEDIFDCEAEIDQVGRLVMTDRTGDTATWASSLTVSDVVFGDPLVDPQIFGTSDFMIIPGDYVGEDGSQMGDTVSAAFAKEALSSTQYSAPSTTIFQDQDGFASGFLQSVSVDTDGIITGHYSNGQVLKKAQVSLATFNSLSGLHKSGGNIFTETTDSGAPITGAAKTNGLGSIAPNALEQSNVDLGTEFVKLITVQRGFQANSKIITTTDEMLNDLINIKR